MKAWLHSAIAAAIGGSASTLSAALVSTQALNFSRASLDHYASIALVGALIPVLALLKQSPLSQKSGPPNTQDQPERNK